MVITCLPELPFFIAVAIFHLSCQKYNVPEVYQSTPSLTLWAKLHAIIKDSFNVVHLMKVCLKTMSFNVHCQMYYSFLALNHPLAVFTYSVFLMMSTLFGIYVKS